MKITTINGETLEELQERKKFLSEKMTKETKGIIVDLVLIIDEKIEILLNKQPYEQKNKI